MADATTDALSSFTSELAALVADVPGLNAQVAALSAQIDSLSATKQKCVDALATIERAVPGSTAPVPA